MPSNIEAVITRVKAWENYCVPHMAAQDRSDLRALLAHIDALRAENEKWQAELMSEASRVNRHVDEIAALRTIVSRVERELDTLSASHKDLAHRLAREGERAEAAEAALAEARIEAGSNSHFAQLAEAREARLRKALGIVAAPIIAATETTYDLNRIIMDWQRVARAALAEPALPKCRACDGTGLEVAAVHSDDTGSGSSYVTCGACDGGGTAPAPVETWRHKKRGTTYTVEIEHGTIQASRPLNDGDVVLTYRGDDGRVWHRPPDEFHDGRFERVDALKRNQGAAALVAGGRRHRRTREGSVHA